MQNPVAAPTSQPPLASEMEVPQRQFARPGDGSSTWLPSPPPPSPPQQPHPMQQQQQQQSYPPDPIPVAPRSLEDGLSTPSSRVPASAVDAVRDQLLDAPLDHGPVPIAQQPRMGQRMASAKGSKITWYQLVVELCNRKWKKSVRNKVVLVAAVLAVLVIGCLAFYDRRRKEFRPSR